MDFSSRDGALGAAGGSSACCWDGIPLFDIIIPGGGGGGIMPGGAIIPGGADIPGGGATGMV